MNEVKIIIDPENKDMIHPDNIWVEIDGIRHVFFKGTYLGEYDPGKKKPGTQLIDVNATLEVPTGTQIEEVADDLCDFASAKGWHMAGSFGPHKEVLE